MAAELLLLRGKDATRARARELRAATGQPTPDVRKKKPASSPRRGAVWRRSIGRRAQRARGRR